MATASMRLGLAALLMLSGAPLAHAQDYPTNDSDQAQRDYDAAQQQYRDAQADHQQREERYQEDQARYQAQRRAYENSRARYEEDRAAYDDAYGAGAFQRYWMSRPDEYDARYGAGAFERDFGAPVAYPDGAGPAPAYVAERCEDRRAGAGLVGGVLGAIAGGAIGNAVGSGGGRAGATAVGAVLGGVVGVGIGRSVPQCDEVGYYYRYDQTYPYRESEYERGRSGRYDYDWYARHDCRLAPARATYAGETEDRWVRVCPDADGRYRITS
ncbi:MAG TPA: hypothetical protein VKU90_12545 [Caulobacteraceae bacterium]|jgi:hypothetical protein|nr:hypothetical protein [Caulobacteraceae bacterium]